MTAIRFLHNATRLFDEAPEDLKRRATPTLDALSAGFEVSWFRPAGKMIWYAVLKPLEWVRQRFGLLHEYLLVANHFDRDFHVRTLEADIDRRVAYRLDRQLRFVASDAPGVDEICASWAQDNGVSVIVLTAEAEKALSEGQAREKLESVLASTLWVRDRFDDSEPVRSPGEFYGREALVNDIVHRLSDGQPVGLMGLRKVGKSSVLRRVEDKLLGASSYLAVTSFVSCNGSDIKSSHWSHLLGRVISDWVRSLSRAAIQQDRQINLQKVRALAEILNRGTRLADDGEVARAFNKDFVRLHKAASSLAGGEGAARFIAFLDEADHLHPESPDALLWEQGFFSFWDTLQALKRGHPHPRALTWMLGGVNPSFVESGSFDGRPNPLFETTVEYLRPMAEAEASDLLNGIGNPMGLTFDRDAIGQVFSFTGGHPWLLRKAGSLVHRRHRTRTGTTSITGSMMRDVLQRSKVSFLNNIEWIVAHLSRIAPDEHALLRDLCLQGPSIYEEDWLDREFRDVFAKHLEDYGLLRFDDHTPRVVVPLVVEAFQKRTSGGLGGQRRLLREAVDGLEASIRFRLRNDLQHPVAPPASSFSSDDGEEFPLRTTQEVISLIVEGIPKSASARAKTRDELRELGRTKGLKALFDALNWDDYVLLIEKNYESLRLKGTPGNAATFVANLRATIEFAHVIRHNNNAELQATITRDGFEGCMKRILDMQGFFAD